METQINPFCLIRLAFALAYFILALCSVLSLVHHLYTAYYVKNLGERYGLLHVYLYSGLSYPTMR